MSGPTQDFVTGATGFIGRFLVANLLKRGGTVHVLVRDQSKHKFPKLQASFGEAGQALVPVWGDITAPGLVSNEDAEKLAGQLDHVFHCAAVYDMTVDNATADLANIEGTRNVVGFVNGLGGNARLHHVSSIVVAGDSFEGTFTEDMFEEGQTHHHPYYRTKFEAEKLVRDECVAPYRIYRPGAVVGSSVTGEMDKVDGAYFFFKTVQRIRDRVPKWLPVVGIEGGTIPVVPVDYVAASIDHIAHVDGLDGKAFHLLQTPEPTVGDLIEVLMKAAVGPEVRRRIKIPELKRRLPQRAQAAAMNALNSKVVTQISESTGMPPGSLLFMVNNPTTFDDSNTRAALSGSGIACPKLEDYAKTLWDYWERELDNAS